VTYGAWFEVHTAYSYSAVALGVILLAARFASSPFYRAQLGIVLLAPTGVLAGNLLHLVFRERLPIDPTPTAFALAFAAVAWALRRHRLLDLLPIARSLTVESLRDGVLVLDAAGRVVDSNPAARSLFGPRASVVGTELGELLGREVPRSSPCELRLESGRRVELRLSPIAGAGGEIGGKVAELRDVTAEREAQDRLDEARRALELANAELERLANTDLLTGLANRRRFLARLEEELGRARRHERPLALLLIDLDRFKEVNDRRGHPVGDKVLEAVGRSLVELLRPEDLAARYGGEELAVLLPETDLEGGRAVAERILGALRALEHRDEGGETFIVTASLGVAALARLDEPARDLIARADAALYAAKDDGRDRVAVAAGRAATPGS
jgi:diguanylate cyclase (GGDEF)-like protein